MRGIILAGGSGFPATLSPWISKQLLPVTTNR